MTGIALCKQLSHPSHTLPSLTATFVCSTFLKRKGGLFKKAHELSVLCSVDVAVFIFGSNKKLYEYSSCDMRDLITRYTYVCASSETSKHNRILLTYLNSMVDRTSTKGRLTLMAVPMRKRTRTRTALPRKPTAWIPRCSLLTSKANHLSLT